MAISEHLSKVRLLLHEPLSEMGGPMTSMLRAEGFSETEHVHSFNAAADRLAGGHVDVLILEADGAEAECEAFIRYLRRGRLGPDPFVCTLVTQSEVTPESFARFSVAGAEWILDKPYSADAVLEHIRNTAHRERVFVISGPYIGPEHRGRMRPGSKVESLTVPNALDALLQGKTPDRKGIAKAAETWRHMLKEAGDASEPPKASAS